MAQYKYPPQNPTWIRSTRRGQAYLTLETDDGHTLAEIFNEHGLTWCTVKLPDGKCKEHPRGLGSFASAKIWAETTLRLTGKTK